VTEQEQAELLEQWVYVKMKAFQPSLSRAETLAIKICPKCRKMRAGVNEELVTENGHRDYGSSPGSSHSSPKQPQTPVTAEPLALEIEPIKSTATVITSPVELAPGM
jgi:hypothetical protein